MAPPVEQVPGIKYSLYGVRPYQPQVPGHGDLLRVIVDEIEKNKAFS